MGEKVSFNKIGGSKIQSFYLFVYLRLNLGIGVIGIEG